MLEGTCADISYPCDYIPSVCDTTMGAGTTYNAGANAANKPCDLVTGRRWIDQDQPGSDRNLHLSRARAGPAAASGRARPLPPR